MNIHTVGNYSALKKKEILPLATVRTNLTLNEISQSQRNKYHKTHLSGALKIVKFTEAQSMAVARIWGRVNGK
jgi:hypothetical protein